MREERGALLFRTAILTPRTGLGIAAAWMVLAALWIFDSSRHGWDAGDVLVGVGYAVIFALFVIRAVRGVLFYEKGVFFPGEPSGGRPRFIPWSAVERYHWDGDVLTVVPQSSILATGGSAPLAGGSVKVPQSRRVEVERLLATAPAQRPQSA